MKSATDLIVEAYELDKPINPKDLDNHILLVVRETAFNIVALIEGQGSGRKLEGIKSVIKEEANKFKELIKGKKVNANNNE